MGSVDIQTISDQLKSLLKFIANETIKSIPNDIIEMKIKNKTGLYTKVFFALNLLYKNPINNISINVINIIGRENLKNHKELSVNLLIV